MKGIGSVLFGLMLPVFAAYILFQAYLTNYWPKTEGTVLSTTIDLRTKRDDEGRTTTYYTPVVSYKYSVNGAQYEAKRVTFNKAEFSTSQEAANISNYFSRNSSVDVYYSPSDPSQAVLVPGITGESYAYMITAAAVALFATFGMFVLVELGAHVEVPLCRFLRESPALLFIGTIVGVFIAIYTTQPGVSEEWSKLTAQIDQEIADARQKEREEKQKTLQQLPGTTWKSSPMPNKTLAFKTWGAGSLTDYQGVASFRYTLSGETITFNFDDGKTIKARLEPFPNALRISTDYISLDRHVDGYYRKVEHARTSEPYRRMNR